MAFDKKLMTKVNVSDTDGKVSVFWAYGPSADDLATISASGFFDDWFNQVSKDDWLFISASDANDIRVFSNATGVTPVTVVPFITASDIADNAVTTPKIADGNVTQVKIAPNSLDGTIAGNVGDANVLGGIPQIFRIDTPGGVTANTDVIVTHKIRVIDVWVENKTGGSASDTIRVFNGAIGAITNAIDVSGGDVSLARTSELNDAFYEIAASGTLRVTETDGGGSDSPATTVYVLAIRVA